MEPLISICIPAYKQPELFERCIKSIINQNYKNIEVIVSDDTPDDSVKIIVDKYSNNLALHYYQNIPSLGSPTNWNAAMDKASGEFIHLLHHDDWLATPTALSTYIAVFKTYTETEVVYSKAVSVNNKGVQSVLDHDAKILDSIYKSPINLILGNKIGPPSVVMVRNSVQSRYNLRYKWVVDIEYYIQLLQEKKRFFFIDEHLVSIGIHADQTTQYCVSDESIILQENIHLLNQFKEYQHFELKIYDFYWRLLRNYKVRSLQHLIEKGVKSNDIPPVIKSIVNFQKKWPLSLLNVGVASKVLMSISYLTSKFS